MKHVKVLSAILGLTILITGSFAFTSKNFHSKFAAKDFQFNATLTPSSTNVILPANYTVVTSTTCPTPIERYCDITIDPVVHPEYVTAGGTQLNFSNATLKADVQAFFNDLTKDGVTVDGITFHDRSNP